MRRTYFGWAIAAIATLGPMQAWGGDREIAEQIINRLKGHRDSGVLQDFTLDMKVDAGVVLLRGSVSDPQQRQVVLNATNGIDGIASIVDEVKINLAQDTSPEAKVVKRKTVAAANTVSDSENLSSQEALTTESVGNDATRSGVVTAGHGSIGSTTTGEIIPTAALELTNAHGGSDQQVTQSVVAALGRAQKNGQLKGFGVDVKSNGGVVELTGRAASQAQRDSILQIASNVPGVVGVREAIQVPAAAASELARLPEPMQYVSEDQLTQTPARLASAPMGVQAMTAPYRGQPAPAMQTGMRMGAPMMGAPVSGGPVPMAPYGGGAASPRYDSPYLPNYAWPGYAAYPNYAAVTYPQQYSPSAWPYIGPFYPYPQVPLGWRKVALEWDDGWWHLDFTDR